MREPRERERIAAVRERGGVRDGAVEWERIADGPPVRPGPWTRRHMDGHAGSRTSPGVPATAPEEREQNAGFAGGNAGDRSRGRAAPWPCSCLKIGYGAAGKKSAAHDGPRGGEKMSGSDIAVFGADVEAGTGAGGVVTVADNLGVRIAASVCPDEGEQRALLRLGAGVARLAVVVASSGVDDGHGAVVHVMVGAVLPAVLVWPDPLVGAVKMDENVVSGVDVLFFLRVVVRLEITCAVPLVELRHRHFAAWRCVGAVYHYGVDGCLA